MRFSIVIPVFNNADNLANCLISIDNLNFPKKMYEIIVVDKNSTDRTAEVARSHGANLLIENDFQSSYAARNRGIKAAKGELIAFTDSDCIVDPNWLLQIDAAVEEGVGCIAGEILSTPSASLIERFSEEVGLLRQRGPLSGWYFKPYAQTANAVYRKTVFDQIGLFDPSRHSGGDATMAWRMQDLTSYKLKFAPEAVVYHRHRSSLSGLWKQFSSYGEAEMNWALAQPDYTPPAITKLEADAVAALDEAVGALEAAKIDEKALLFPVLRTATRLAHLSGYLQDLLTMMAHGLPLDKVPHLARQLAPRCNICGGTTFLPGPNNRMENGRAPQCAQCGSLERHRVLAMTLDGIDGTQLARSSVISFREWLPPSLAKRFASANRAQLGTPEARRYSVALAMNFSSMASAQPLISTISELVGPLENDGVLILIDRAGQKIDYDAKTKIEFNINFVNFLREILPNANIIGEEIVDIPTGSSHYSVIIKSH